MDALEIRRRRALYRSAHRGTKELDFMLGGFAKIHVAAMDESAMSEFEHLIALPDPDIDEWIRGKPAPDGIARTIAGIRAFLGMK